MSEQVLHDVGDGVSAEFVRSLGHHVPSYIPNAALCRVGKTSLPNPILPDGWTWVANYDEWINHLYENEVIVTCPEHELPNAKSIAQRICAGPWADQMDELVAAIEVQAEREAGAEILAEMRNAIMSDMEKR